MRRTLQSGDAGKPLVTADGHVVGVVDRLDGTTAYVRPRPDLLRGTGSWIGGSTRDVGAFRLDDDAVAAVDRERVILDAETTDPPGLERVD